MRLWCCITPERERKTRMIMEAVATGWPKAKIQHDSPPDDGAPFIVWGQEWLTLRIVPQALEQGRPFFHIDNGYWNPARGGQVGYYRVTYRSMTPVLLDDPDLARANAIGVMEHLKPWYEEGIHVLYAEPGRHFGLALGINMDEWMCGAIQRIRKSTKRPIKTRSRQAQGTPLEPDLRGCWCLVTHSSNVAVEAAIAGMPVFVEPTSAAAPIGRTDFCLESPYRPDRLQWLASLMCQQFTLDEMATGVLYHWMQRVVEQVDAKCEPVSAIA
jgi:hypothetical protein